MSKVQEKEIKVQHDCPHACEATPCGDRFMIKAKLSVNGDGEQIAEPGDKIDLFAYVQASVASTDMAQIVARWQAGDETVINVNPNGYYGDTTIIPSSVNDYEKIIKLSDSALSNFNKLPDDIRALFGNKAEEFFNAVLNNKADDIVSEYLKKQTIIKPEEVTANE